LAWVSYYITDHYKGWPAVLARLSALTVAEASLRVERAWRIEAPRALVRALDDGAAGAAGPRRPPRAGTSPSRSAGRRGR
jgi:hypothetical protein